jgi:hypothetical protein
MHIEPSDQLYRKEMLVFLLFLRHILSSKLSLETGYPDWRFSVLFPDSQKLGYKLKIDTKFCCTFLISSQIILPLTPQSRRRIQPLPVSFQKLAQHCCFPRGSDLCRVVYKHVGPISTLEPSPHLPALPKNKHQRNVMGRIRKRYCPFLKFGTSLAYIAKRRLCSLTVDPRVCVQSRPPILHVTTEITGPVLT